MRKPGDLLWGMWVILLVISCGVVIAGLGVAARNARNVRGKNVADTQPGYAIEEIVPGRVVIVKATGTEAISKGIAEVGQGFDISGGGLIASVSDGHNYCTTTAVLLFVTPKIKRV